MEINITFQYGPISAEIEASEEEDYVEELDTLANFLQDYPDIVEKTNSKGENKSKSESTSNDAASEDAHIEDFGSHSNESSEDEVYIENNMVRPILSKIEVSEERFIRAFEVDEQVTPRILKPNEVPGETKGEIVLNASLIITTIWQECYDEDWMKTSELSNALDQSGLSDRTDYIYNQDNWESMFNKEGEKRGTKLRVTRLGKDRAEELINDIAK